MKHCADILSGLYCTQIASTIQKALLNMILFSIDLLAVFTYSKSAIQYVSIGGSQMPKALVT